MYVNCLFSTQCHLKFCYCSVSVLDSKSRNIPEVVLVRRWAVGVGNLEGRGELGDGWSKWGQFTSNLRPRWTIPVTAGGCQVSGRGNKAGARGSQQRGGKKNSRGMRHVYM